MRKRAVTLGIILVTAACLFGGCVDNDQSLTVVGVAAPDDGCNWQIDPDVWLAAGTFDVSYQPNPSYMLVPQLNNNMPCNCDTDNAQLCTLDVLIERITVNYRWLEGRDVVESSHSALLLLEDMEQVIYTATMVSAGAAEGCDAGKLLIFITAVPPEIGGQLSGLGADADGLVLGLEVSFQGTTVGGTEVSSNEFIFPVYLCSGCRSVVCCPGTSEEYYPGCAPGQDNLDLSPCECGTP